jgi:hypothetical protein
MPVMMVDRQGAQTPAAVNAFEYRTPSFANRSSFGVMA